MPLGPEILLFSMDPFWICLYCEYSNRRPLVLLGYLHPSIWFEPLHGKWMVPEVKNYCYSFSNKQFTGGGVDMKVYIHYPQGLHGFIIKYSNYYAYQLDIFRDFFHLFRLRVFFPKLLAHFFSPSVVYKVHTVDMLEMQLDEAFGNTVQQYFTQMFLWKSAQAFDTGCTRLRCCLLGLLFTLVSTAKLSSISKNWQELRGFRWSQQEAFSHTSL